jgi:uncharacterized protein
VRLVSYPDGPSLLRAAGEWLEQAEAEHCYLLGTCAAARTGAAGPGRLFLGLEDAQGPVGVAVQVPPGPLGVSKMSEAAVVQLVRWLREQGARPAHVVGPTRTVERFAALWVESGGGRAVPVMGQGVYALTHVTPPSRMPEGSLREAEARDSALLGEWAEDFAVESGLPEAEQRTMRSASAAWIADRLAWVWEAEGKAVTMAVVQGPTPRGIRVGMVYTPPQLRGRGYASALVARVSQHQLDLGRRACFLFTNLANPTSNGIYQAVGYVQVGEAQLVRLEAAGQPGAA